jgi:FHS family L-fucose permease-like MFS transporter
LKQSDLGVLIGPYLIIGLVIAAMFLVILFTKMPKNGDQSKEINFLPTLKRIFGMKRYREGVIAQFFYVGAQIMCWTFVIQYGTRVFMAEGMSELDAEVLSQTYNIVAMVIFCCSRFICTFILRYLNAGMLLGILAVAACVFTCGVIFFQDRTGMYCLVAVSACMSLMFPTIYGIALKGMGDDAKFGAAGLIMAILGGSVLPPMQASIIDMGTCLGMPAVNISFVLPLICFVVITIYGYRSYLRSK